MPGYDRRRQVNILHDPYDSWIHYTIRTDGQVSLTRYNSWVLDILVEERGRDDYRRDLSTICFLSTVCTTDGSKLQTEEHKRLPHRWRPVRFHWRTVKRPSNGLVLRYRPEPGAVYRKHSQTSPGDRDAGVRYRPDLATLCALHRSCSSSTGGRPVRWRGDVASTARPQHHPAVLSGRRETQFFGAHIGVAAVIQWTFYTSVFYKLYHNSNTAYKRLNPEHSRSIRCKIWIAYWHMRKKISCRNPFVVSCASPSNHIVACWIINISGSNLYWADLHIVFHATLL